MKSWSRGFSLIEVLVVVSIIAILSAVLYVNFSESSAQSRDAERKSDLRNMQNAIELYKLENGRYPEGCNGPNVWSGQMGTDNECSNNTGIYAPFVGTRQYIIGLAPDFIPVLPFDPKLNGDETDSGYMYAVNTEGTVYKIMAKKTVESEVLSNKNFDFESCDITSNGKGVCDASYDNSNNPQAWCTTGNTQFRASYALWGGYPLEPRPTHATRYEEMQESIICDIP